MLIDPEAVKADLRSDVLEVQFYKEDGTVRTMRCTLDPRRMPPPPEPKLDENGDPVVKKTKAPNPKVITVWDTGANGWRSFRTDSVISIQTVNTI